MKKMKWLSAMLIAGVFAFTACSDDEGNGENFSDLPVEEQKAQMESEGIAMVQKMDEAKSLQTYDVLDSFFALMDEANAEPVKALEFSLNEVMSLQQTKSIVSLKGALVDKMRASDEFYAETGVYEWDAAVGDWAVVEQSDSEVTYRFPVEEQTAEISVYGFAVKDATHQDDPEMVIELPLSLNAHVKLGEVVITSFSLTAEWNDDDTPKNITEIITLENFSFTSELTNTTSKVGASAAFKYKEEMIYGNGFTLEGDFSYDEIFNTIPGDETGMDDALAQEVLEKANVWFQLGNIKIEGILDFKGFMEALADKVETVNMEDEDAFNDMMVELINEYAILYVRFADSNEIIAKGEFYLEEVDDLYGGSYVEPAFLMVFGDGSKMTVDQFVEEGFGDLLDEVESFINALEEAYGEEEEVVVTPA
ncbi:hypothetical protein J1N10_18595 [Carboxylicivirga sp. A043]|uniref:hypothetical protein n=1 Tax=Carboxylicivirga litoralis TaxID=2816963 RepID=UPI0021CB013C|nr:hypothetical protein [Carboxylicivirga sp. A043]MCU4157990.1 hypothetical protein [Carboxylicivirga sp. A043]